MTRRTITTGVARISALLLLFAVAGCSNHPAMNGTEVDEEIVVIPQVIRVPPLEQASRGENPRDLLEFGLALGRSGKHTEAAEWFLDASRIESRESAWAVACLSESAYQSLLADDVAAFRNAVESIKKHQNRWAELAPDPMTEAMIVLYELGTVDADQSSVPFKYRYLFR